MAKLSKQQLWDSLRLPTERGTWNCKNHSITGCSILNHYNVTGRFHEAKCNCYGHPKLSNDDESIPKDVYTSRWEWDGKTK